MKKALLLLAFVLCLLTAKAQNDGFLLYREYDPDDWFFVHDFQSHGIDVDMDNEPDFQVYAEHNIEYIVWPHVRNYFVPWEDPDDDGQGPNYPWKLCNYLLEGQELDDEALVWENAVAFSHFGDTLSYYLGIRHREGEDYYYGWTRFYITHSEDYTYLIVHIAEICYCTIPGYPLCMGQTNLTGMAEGSSQAFAVVQPNPTTGVVSVTGSLLSHAEVINTLGQRVASVSEESDRISIDISGLPAGLYFINITDREGLSCVKKIVKQ